MPQPSDDQPYVGDPITADRAVSVGMMLKDGLGRAPTKSEFDAVLAVLRQTLVDVALAEAVFRERLAITWDGETIRYMPTAKERENYAAE